MKEELEEICEWKPACDNQMATEKARGEDSEGTSSYYKIGCPGCDGYETCCDNYYGKKIKAIEFNNYGAGI